MTQFFRMLVGLLLAALMTACGGGGGSPGTTTGGNSAATPTVILELVDSSGAPITTVEANKPSFARATVRDAGGAAVAGAVVTMSGSSDLVSFSPASGTALTDASGVASVQVMPATESAAGAGTLNADAQVAGKAAKQGTFSIQVIGTLPNVTLELVTSTGATTTTVGTLPVFARARVRDSAGAVVSGAVVKFTVDSALARFLPSSGTSLTDASGLASVQILPASSTSAGAGVLKVDATVGGKTAKQASLSFQVAPGAVDPATSKVANFVLLLDRSTLSNSGTATAKLTVVAVDANNNVAPGATVNVATDANTVFTPAAAVTDAQGQYTGQIGIGADKSDRQVIVTVTVNGIVKQTSLQIAGSKIEITSTPTLLAPSGSSSVTGRLTDAAAQPIVNTRVTFGGDIAAVAGSQAFTDINGRATINFTAPAAPGNYIVLASANGVTSQLSVQVGSSAEIPTAVIPVGAQPGLSVTPSVLAPNIVGSTINQGQLRFLFLNAANQPIPNVRVKFAITSTGLGSFDSSISTGTSTVHTNASGIAAAAFVPGSTGSPTDGVVVRACYRATDFDPGTTCDSSIPGVNVRLTIAAQALAVSIGDDNKMQAGPGGTYIKQLVVTVADAAGRAVADAGVDISLDITHFGKGLFSQAVTFPLNVGAANTYVPDKVTAPSTFGARVSCVNEDTNRNGFVDGGENINGSVDSFGQPTLEPRRSDIILSYVDPAVRKTNASGILLIQVEHSQRFGTWLSYRVRATTSVSGSQGSAERAFVTAILEDDFENGSFHTPPYGTGACNNAN
jgi:hypothetical protein